MSAMLPELGHDIRPSKVDRISIGCSFELEISFLE